jgi:radical SAM superfamily enzyme YgiQ (UPF0313 family)
MIAKRAIDIWLCDLTYTQQTIASDVMPNAIGCIAMYCKKELGDAVEINLLKRPEEVCEWFDTKQPPKIAGFSNYTWNEALSLRFAKKVKATFPDTTIVMGGPNYPLNLLDREAYLRKHSFVDFFVIKEGEVAFADLVGRLIESGFDQGKFTESMPSVDYIDENGNFVHYTEYARRIRNLEEIPSPYTSGLMDRYFDGQWLPIIQTNRGCPFTCTFCVEGNDFYTKVFKSGFERVKSELEYIADKVESIDNDKKRRDLHIADSNFGMYKEDIDTCKVINRLQSKYGFPEYINVATGKNQKQRVLEAARLVNGALRLSGSVQSLDASVLKNIKRNNISLDSLVEMALEAREAGANTYSEIILGLPGDTITAHFESIRRIIESEFNIVCLYQLMLLPGTDMGTPESRKQFGFKTAYRVLPRCFATYRLLGEDISVAEVEEIVLENNAINLDDYLSARRMHLVINAFFNDGVYKDIFPLFKLLRIPKYDWLAKVHSSKHVDFNELTRSFSDETVAEVWQSRDELEAFTSQAENIQEYLDGKRGSNLIFKYKLTAVISYTKALYEVANETIQELFRERGQEDLAPLAEEILRFCTCRMLSMFDLDLPEIQDSFHFKIVELLRTQDFENWRNYREDEPQMIQFVRTKDQADLLSRYIDIYGSDMIGLSRIVSKIYVGRLLRQPRQSTEMTEEDRRELDFGQARLSGLNPFV